MKTKWNLFVVLAIVLGIFVVYAPSINHPFVWTDHAEVEQGALVPKSLQNFLDSFTKPKGEAMSTARSAFQSKTRGNNRYAYFRPIKAITYWIDNFIGSSKPWSFHLTNILIHIATCLLILLVFSSIDGGRYAGVAKIAALIHAVNPLNIEVVEWISARSDSLMALFVLSSLWFSLEAGNRSGWRSFVMKAAAGIMAIFALWSKESGIVAVPIMAVVAFSLNYQNNKKALASVYNACWLPGLLVTLALVWRFLIVSDINLSQFSHKHGLGMWTILYLFGHNLWMSFLPSGMTVADTVVIRNGPSVAAIAGPLVWISWFAVGVWKIKKHPLLFICSLGWLLAVGPVSQAVVLIHPRADRYLYLPTIFAACTLAWIFLSLHKTIATKRFLSVISSVTFVLLILLLAFLSRKESEKWSDEIRLFVESLILQPHCIECWNNLAYAQALKGNIGGAAYSCTAALSIDRKKYRGAKDGFSLRWILSKSLLIQKKGAKAAAVLEEMIFVLGPNTGLLNMLAMAYMQDKRPAHALAAANLALELSPDNQTSLDLLTSAMNMEIKLGFPLLFSNPEACQQ